MIYYDYHAHALRWVLTTGEHEGSGALHDLIESIEERLRLLFVPKQLHIRCALVGPAQCGKSTVVAELTQEEVGSVYRYKYVLTRPALHSHNIPHLR
jgi:polynucleotide 5'-kinase involved in rRNA processing